MNRDDREFLSRMGAELSGLLDNFAEAATLASTQQKQEWADQRLKIVFRDGWFVNTPVGARGDAESVADHVDHLCCLIDRYFPAQHRDTGQVYARTHDRQESIANVIINGIRRDLNPRFNKESYGITGEDKNRIEDIAIALLCDGDVLKQQEWKAFQSDAEDARLFKALDSICVMWRCVEYITERGYKYSDFQQYWDYWGEEKAHAKLPSPIKEAYCDDLLPHINKLRIG